MALAVELVFGDVGQTHERKQVVKDGMLFFGSALPPSECHACVPIHRHECIYVQ